MPCVPASYGLVAGDSCCREAMICQLRVVPWFRGGVSCSEEDERCRIASDHVTCVRTLHCDTSNA